MPRLVKTRLGKLWTVLVSPALRVNCSPIIVLGKEKSGTTVIAALLARHTGLSVTLDLPGIWGPVETKILAGDMAFDKFVQLNRYHFSRDIIKEPCLTFLYPQVKRTFPQAQFAMIVRDPRDNMRSVLNRLGIRGDLENIDTNTFSNIPAGWQVVLDGRWLGLQGNTYVEMLAARWNLAVDTYLEHRGEMVLVRYEDFVADKASTIEHLAQQFALPHVNNISHEVDTQYQPRGEREISWIEFFGPENLGRVESICDSRMAEFGYRAGIRR